MKEKTFEELIKEKLTATKEGYVVYTDDIKELLQQVREATIAEAIEYCVSNEWIVTIDNLKKMPTDKIIIYENK